MTIDPTLFGGVLWALMCVSVHVAYWLYSGRKSWGDESLIVVMGMMGYIVLGMFAMIITVQLMQWGWIRWQ